MDKVIGWEASVPLDVDSYKFRAHIQVYDDDGNKHQQQQTPLIKPLI
ncbi:MAG: hypothetical protein U0586_05445 [Candidatus Brocadiaceae bacterium]